MRWLPTARASAVCAAAPHFHCLLPCPQRCSASGASTPASRMVVLPMRNVSPLSACARPSIGLALANDGSQPRLARSPAPWLTNHAIPATAATAMPATRTRGERPSVAKRGMPIPVMRDSIGRAAANSTRPMPMAIRVSPSAPMLRKRPRPDPSAMAPASARGPPTFGRSSTTVRGRNATPSLRIRTSAAAPSFCSSTLPAATSELPALCAAMPATPMPARAPSRAAAPAALEPAASAAPAALICWAAACLASSMRRRRFSRRTLIVVRMYWFHSKPSGFFRQPNMSAALPVELGWPQRTAPLRAKLLANRGSDGTPNRPVRQPSAICRAQMATGRSSPTVTFLPNNCRHLAPEALLGSR